MSEKPTISDTDYGYNGLLTIFSQRDIDVQDWCYERLDKERGGITFKLPSAEGEIYLNWGDLYHVKVTFVNSKQTFDEDCLLGDLHLILDRLEQQRKANIGALRDMIKNAFGEEQ